MSLENLEFIRGMFCHVCKARPVDIHHWRSKGAGGGNTLDNLVPLCRKHHSEFHNSGSLSFYKRYGKKLEYYRKIEGLPKINRGKHG